MHSFFLKVDTFQEFFHDCSSNRNLCSNYFLKAALYIIYLLLISWALLLVMNYFSASKYLVSFYNNMHIIIIRLDRNNNYFLSQVDNYKTFRDLYQMGNNASQHANLKFYSFAYHPIVGDVKVFVAPNLGKFIMKIDTYLQDKSEIFKEELRKKSILLQKISSLKSEYLVPYLGKQINPMKPFSKFEQSSEALDQQTKQISKIAHGMPKKNQQYWQFYNYDLDQHFTQQKQKVLTNENTLILDEAKIIELVTALIQVSQQLKQIGIIPQLNMKIIQYSSGMVPQLFWRDFKQNNQHRSYYKYFNDNKYSKTLYSPQELMSMKINTLNQRINLQKCVVYQIGMILLQIFSCQAAQQLYIYQLKEIDEHKKNQRINSLRNKTYHRFWRYLLRKMLEIVPSKRIDLANIMQEIDGYLKKEE